MDTEDIAAEAGVVHVCPTRDIECGSNPASWCKSCPKRPAEAGRVPPGWKLVPVEPTIAMCIAGDGARMNVDDMTRTPAIYRAMLAAALQPPKAQPAEAGRVPPYDEQVMLKLCPYYGPSPGRDAWIAGYEAAHGILPKGRP